MNGTTIRILIIDEHRLWRDAIGEHIQHHPQLEVVASVPHNEQAIAIAKREKPHVIIVDIDDHDSLLIIPSLLDVTEGRIIVLTRENDQTLYHKAVHLGAQGIVSKSDSPTLLTNAILKVHGGEVWLNRTMVAHLLEMIRRPEREPSAEEVSIKSLTEREREIITWVGRGLKNDEIGQRLFISSSTVRHHLTSIYSKLQVSDRLELLIYAYRYHLVDLPR